MNDAQRKFQSPLAHVNEKARAAASGDENTVRELVGVAVEVFTPPGVLTSVKNSMKERLTRAEINFRKGGKARISEHQVAKTVNDLADKFKAPAYAKTNPAQVRELRMTLMVSMPNFIGEEVVKGKDKNKPEKSDLGLMSPIEGAFVAAMMIEQKMFNDEYQVPAQAFFANKRKKEAERLREIRARMNSGGLTPDAEGRVWAKSSIRHGNPKRAEMKQVVARGVQALSFDELTNLADTSLDSLGIER